MSNHRGNQGYGGQYPQGYGTQEDDYNSRGPPSSYYHQGGSSWGSGMPGGVYQSPPPQQGAGYQNPGHYTTQQSYGSYSGGGSGQSYGGGLGAHLPPPGKSRSRARNWLGLGPSAQEEEENRLAVQRAELEAQRQRLEQEQRRAAQREAQRRADEEARRAEREREAALSSFRAKTAEMEAEAARVEAEEARDAAIAKTKAAEAKRRSEQSVQRAENFGQRLIDLREDHRLPLPTATVHKEEAKSYQPDRMKPVEPPKMGQPHVRPPNQPRQLAQKPLEPVMAMPPHRTAEQNPGMKEALSPSDEAALAAKRAEMAAALAAQRQRLESQDDAVRDLAARLTVAEDGLESLTPEHRAQARKALGIPESGTFHIGFCGGSGVGKSALINAIRGIKDTAPGAAPVDVFGDAGVGMQRYEANEPGLYFWDLPGGGTLGVPGASYFMDQKLYAFDMLVIVSCSRFVEFDIQLASAAASQNDQKLYAFDMLVIVSCSRFVEFDIQLASAAASQNIKVMFVRNKTDVDIDNRADREESTPGQVKHQLRAEIERTMESQLPPELASCPVFLLNVKVLTGKRRAEDYGLDEGTFLQTLHNYSAS